MLAYVLVFGFAWDLIFILVQRLRWDRDWPAVFQVGSGILEGALIFTLIRQTGLPGIAEDAVSFGTFLAHYGLVWLVTFVWVQGPMRALLPRWRFTGGRVV